jgi:ketosteroid isomerase-like protein
MSQENVAIVERIFAAAGTPLAFEVYSEDIEWDMTNYAGWPDKPVYRGHEGVREMVGGWITAFDHWEPTIEHIVALGDEVIAIVSDRAYMKGSSTSLVRRFAQTFTFRAGKIVRSRLFSDPDEALKAVGLAE